MKTRRIWTSETRGHYSIILIVSIVLKNNYRIIRLENEMRENKKELLWKEQTISEMTMESVKVHFLLSIRNEY